MNLQRLSAVAAHATFMVLTGISAQAASGPDGDIVGLRLNMSSEEAKQAIETDYPGAHVTMLPVILSAAGYRQETTAGFIVDLLAKDDSDANKKKFDQQDQDARARAAAGLGSGVLSRVVSEVGDFSQDRVKVLFDPNPGSSDIFAISRYTEYGPGKQPVTQTMTEALTEKYGAPAHTDKDGGWLTYSWSQSGTARPARNSLTHCYKPGGNSFLYDNAGDQGFYGLPNALSTTSEAFARTVDLIHNRNPFAAYGSCGKVLEIKLKLIKNGDYVGAMSARLNDLGKAYAELDSFGNAFWRQQEAARQNGINSDASKKPKL